MGEVVTEKVYCTGQQPDNSAMWAALNNGGMNGGWNNPFIYLVWMMFAQRMWGNGENAGENYNSRQIAALQDSVNTNHNNDLVMQAMSNNQAAVRELAQTFNTDINSIQSAICNVKSAVEAVGGSVGINAERVINAANLGNLNIIQQLKDCCCNTQQTLLSTNAANQLKDCEYHGQTISRIDQLANGIQQGFASIGYAAQSNTQAIINASNANTQRILDQMCANTTQSLRDEIAQKDRELQTATIVSQVRNSGCNC